MNKPKTSTLTMIAPLPAIRKRTRLAKMLPLFLDHGFKVNFIGWERERGEVKEQPWDDPQVTERIILKGGGYASKKVRLMYPLWMIAVFWTVLSLGRHKSIICLGWETAFPARLAAALTRSTIIFDDADRFSLILKLPRILNVVLVRLERWTSYNCFLHIVPGLSRYEWRHDKMVVLQNSPTSADFALAKKMAPDRGADDLVIYANGWLGQTRGAPIILEALNGLQDKAFTTKVHIAGRVDSPDGEKLISHQLVEFHGEVPQHLALALYISSDIVLTLYDPAITINRQAESNKWGDCIFFETPFIVNSEVETAQKFVTNGAAFSFEYKNSRALASLLQSIVDDRTKLKTAKQAIATFKSDFPVFDEQIEKLVSLIKVDTHE